jgi:two-component system CheB/CheR fusion protein
VQAFQGRLRGMAATHDLLAHSNWHGATLGELVDTALRGHASSDGSTSRVDGPALMMTPNAAATLGMAFYELATNAAKYGALNGNGGQVGVSWQIDGALPAGRVKLVWTESGGKTAPKDLKAGFGVSFVKRTIEYELDGTAKMEPAPGGLRWTLEFPVAKNVQQS